MKFRTSSIIEFIIRLRVIIVQQKYSFGISFRNVVTDVYRQRLSCSDRKLGRILGSKSEKGFSLVLGRLFSI